MKKNKKMIGTVDVLAIAFGAMIGWGWVISSGIWISGSGVLGTILGFIVGGLMIYFVGLTYAELASAIPENGGAQIFTDRAFGRRLSFICAWAMILSYFGVVCFEACSLPTIIQYVFPNTINGYLYTVGGFEIYASWLLMASVATIFITVINIVGLKTAAKIQTIFTLIIGLVGIFLTVASLINGNVNNLEGQFINDNMVDAMKSIFSVAVVAPFYLFGFDVIPQASEEIDMPKKRLGCLIMSSIIMAVVFYSMVVFSVGYAMNPADIAKSMSGTGLVTADAMTKVFNNSAMTKILIIGGLCGIITSWNAFLIGGSRALASLSDAGIIPGFFGKVHKKYKTPYIAISVLGIISFVSLFSGRAMLVWISNISSFACCLTYGIVAASFLKLRRSRPDLDRPYKIKNFKLVGIMAIGLSASMLLMYMIPGTGSTLEWNEWLIFILWFASGMILYTFSSRKVNKFDGLS